MVGAELSRSGEDALDDDDNDGSDPALAQLDDDGPMPASSAQGQLTMFRQERRYSGPLPDPESLEAYKRIDPRFPDAILSAFQEQSTHRHEMERKLLEGSERRANIGQWLGTCLLLTGLGGGIWVTLAGQPVVGGAMVAASLAVGALSYVFGDYRKKE